MLIVGLMIIFIILQIALGFVLNHYSTSNFLIYRPSENPGLKELMVWTARLLWLNSLLGVVLLFFGLRLNLITLLIGSIIVAFFAMRLSSYN